MNARPLITGFAVLFSGLATGISGCKEDPTAAAPVVGALFAPAPLDAGRPSDAGASGRSDAQAGRRLGTLDRVGKAYVSLILVSIPNRDEYNLAPVEGVEPTDPARDGGASTFGADFQSVLTKLDAMDGTSEWNGGAATAGPDDAGLYPHPLANAWVSADALLVDPNKPFSSAGYLDLEVNGAAAESCGGRWLNDDALDKTMSFLVRRSLTGVGDGVAGPARRASREFPYLAAPF